MVSKLLKKWISLSLAVFMLAFVFSVPGLAASDTRQTQSTTSSTLEAYNVYFGQLHSHTNISPDSIGTLDEAFSYARDTAKLDFFAVTDRSEAFDNAASATLTNGMVSTEWISGILAASKYTTSSFVGIYGYEMSFANGYGHINTFNTLGFENRDKTTYTGTQGLINYYAALKQYPDSISQFNHPGTLYGDFQDFAHYDAQTDAVISLFEVGSGEGTIGSNQYYRAYDLYNRALDKGWHLAPTNNQNNRRGLWGTANTGRTVALAKSLTQSDIYDAMKKMRVYATEDQNLKIRYYLNDKVMGSRITQKPDSVRIKAFLEETGGEALGKVSVVVNGGRVISSVSLGVSQYVLDLTLDSNYSYYYLRIDQVDGDIAVTAPVWIDSNKTGIAQTYANTTQPKKGVPLKITSEIYNHELVPMTLQSLTFSIGSNTIKSFTSQDVINAMSKALYTFDYTPAAAGRVVIDVKLMALVNGVSRVYTDKLILNVTDPAAPPTPPTTDQEAANLVIALINKIHQPANKPHWPQVEAARTAYNALTDPQKRLVTNYDKLVAAENRLEWLFSKGKNKGHYKRWEDLQDRWKDLEDRWEDWEEWMEEWEEWAVWMEKWEEWKEWAKKYNKWNERWREMEREWDYDDDDDDD